MGGQTMVYTHQSLGFTSNHILSPQTKLTNLRQNAITSPAAGIELTFTGTCKLRQPLNLSTLSPFTSSSKSNPSHLCRSQLVQDIEPVASAGYAALLLGGGLCAYNKSGSKGSVFGGLTGEILMSVAYYLMQSPETKELGDALAFGASLLFVCIFGIRFAASRKLVPAGFLLGVSICLTALTYSAYLQDKI